MKKTVKKSSGKVDFATIMASLQADPNLERCKHTVTIQMEISAWAHALEVCRVLQMSIDDLVSKVVAQHLFDDDTHHFMVQKKRIENAMDGDCTNPSRNFFVEVLKRVEELEKKGGVK